VCCTLICGQDDFCCDVEWDELCADAACAQCSSCNCFPKCTLSCEAGDSPEGEPCGSDSNGGCNSTPTHFGTVTHQETICGSAWATGGVRDTDWFLLHTDYVATRITASIASEFSSVAYVLEGLSGCAPLVIGVPGDSAGCVSGVPASAVVPASDYAIFVATSTFNGVPCGGTNTYRVAVIAICDGDTNADLVVNVVDLVNVVINWGGPGLLPGIDADVDDTGAVDVVDLITVVRRWGECVEDERKALPVNAEERAQEEREDHRQHQEGEPPGGVDAENGRGAAGMVNVDAAYRACGAKSGLTRMEQSLPGARPHAPAAHGRERAWVVGDREGLRHHVDPGPGRQRRAA
jgi:hypothetical protein